MVDLELNMPVGIGDMCVREGNKMPFIITLIRMYSSIGITVFSGVYVDGNTICEEVLQKIHVLEKSKGRTVSQMLELADKFYRT